jgi:GNAT superfamily N-acetyltransferase
MSGVGSERIAVRETESRDFGAIGELCGRVYPEDRPWRPEELGSHRQLFPDGQLVAVDREAARVVGMCASLIVRWDRYDDLDSWEAFTARGTFANHDPEQGRTLYAAEAIVDPTLQGHGVGGKLYAARRALVHRLGLLRIRGGARLRGYHEWAGELGPEDYVRRVVHGEIRDPTLSFQLHEGFHVLAVIPHYLEHDPETLGYAALIEWLNSDLVEPHHHAERPVDFLHRDELERVRSGR